MKFSAQLRAATAADRDRLLSAPIITDCLAGKVSRDSYRAFLTEAYHHVKHTVPLLMACGARLPERLEWLRRGVAEYIEEEYGHEQWILADLAEAGFDAAVAMSCSARTHSVSSAWCSCSKARAPLSRPARPQSSVRN
jgi:long-chain acyl-CoA synthetase